MSNFFINIILEVIFFLNKIFNDFGITIIFFTFLTRLIFLPLNYLIFLDGEKLKKITPQIKEIQKNYSSDLKKQLQAIQEIYQKEKYSPFKTTIIQLFSFPFLIFIFLTLKNLISSDYNLFFLGIINLKERNPILIFLVIVFQLMNIFRLPQEQRKISLFIFGAVILILIQFPALFNLYWLTNLSFALIEKEIFKKLKKKTNDL